MPITWPGSWPLASGHSPDRLLDTYGQERGPVAADVLALTHTLVRLGTMTHPVQRALRDTIVPMACRLAPIQRRAVRRMSHIQVSYPSSPLTHPGGNREGVQPGQRAPDLEVTGDGEKTRLYEVLRRGQHVLLISAPDPGGDWQTRMQLWQDQVDVVVARTAVRASLATTPREASACSARTSMWQHAGPWPGRITFSITCTGCAGSTRPCRLVAVTTPAGPV